MKKQGPLETLTVTLALKTEPVPTARLEDLGFNDLGKKIIKAGWALEDGTVIKPFKYTYNIESRAGIEYITWTAFSEKPDYN